jgi:uncharacterized membrane protein
MNLYLLAPCIGVVAGMRAITAPAAISWAAHLGWLPLQSTWLAFLGYSWTPWIFTLLALGELVTDQLPSTPSRTVPLQFGARLASGALSGGSSWRGWWIAPDWRHRWSNRSRYGYFRWPGAQESTCIFLRQ